MLKCKWGAYEWLHPIHQLILQKNEAIFIVNYDLQKPEIKDLRSRSIGKITTSDLYCPKDRDH